MCEESPRSGQISRPNYKRRMIRGRPSGCRERIEELGRKKGKPQENSRKTILEITPSRAKQGGVLTNCEGTR